MTDKAKKLLFLKEQREHFPEVFEYSYKKCKPNYSIPNIVYQLNIIPDNDGILRVKSKLKGSYVGENYPILLPSKGYLTKLIVMEIHFNCKHIGLYHLLSETRKQFWIPKIFSVCKKLLKQCIICKRYNNKNVSLNQNSYREIRISPNEIPFSNIYIDFCGPFFVKIGNCKEKLYLLVVTCMFTRAIDLKICHNLTIE